MPADDDAGDSLSASTRQLLELLAALGTETVVARADLSAAIVRRARRQHDTRSMLVVGSGVLAAVVTGLAGLFPRADVQDGGR